MKKTRIAICVLLGLLVFSTAQSISISAVSANNVIPAVFCPNNFQPGNDTENEITLARATCTYIRNLLTVEYPGVATLVSMTTALGIAILAFSGH